MKAERHEEDIVPSFFPDKLSGGVPCRLDQLARNVHLRKKQLVNTCNARTFRIILANSVNLVNASLIKMDKNKSSNSTAYYRKLESGTNELIDTGPGQDI